MLNNQKKGCKVVLCLAEFDAVCDEFLKAFEVIDQNGTGVITASGFAAYKGLLTGQNVAHLNVASGCAVGKNVTALTSSVSRPCAVLSAGGGTGLAVDHLSEPANVLFNQKKCDLLALAFEAIDTENLGVIEAVQILEAVGLASAVGYLRTIYPGNQSHGRLVACAVLHSGYA